MKRISILLFLIFAFVAESCITHYFSQPLPANAETIFTMPDEIQGSWNTNDNEEVIIDKTSWTVISVDSLGVKSSKKEYEVSDSLVIKKWRKKYFFNVLEGSGYYTVYVGYLSKNIYFIKKMGDGDTLSLKKILNIEPDSIEETRRYYDVPLSKRQMNKFVRKGGFSDTLMKMDLQTRIIVK